MSSSPTFQALTISRRESGFGANVLDNAGDLVDVPPVGRRPRPPLIAVDRPQLALLVGPLVPDRDALFAQVGDVRLAAQEPQQLVDDRLEVQLLGGQERKTFGQIMPKLQAETAQRARAGAIVLSHAAVQHLSQATPNTLASDLDPLTSH